MLINLTKVGMTLTCVTALSGSFALAVGPLPVQAANPQDIQRLIQTGECSGCDLSDANLEGVHVLGADLRGANLQGADLTEANFEGADLTGANLKDANLTAAYLTNATLDRADLTNANLSSARLYNAATFGAILNGINIQNAEIYGSGISAGGDY